jgi:DNA-binding beta-propeller fold protein YncE
VTYLGYGWTSLGGQTYGLTLSNLEPGQVRWVTLVVTTSQPASGVVVLNNVANAAAVGALPVSATNTLALPLYRTFLPLVAKPPIGVSFTSDRFEVRESVSPANIGIGLSLTACIPVSVTFGTSDGTATAGQDYTTTLTTAVIPAGAISTTVAVGIISDNLPETNETVQLTLSSPQGAVLAHPFTATLTIIDDDSCEPTQIPSYFNPIDLVYQASTDRLFIANRDGIAGGSVSVTHVSPIQHIANITGVLSAQGLVADEARQRLYVVGWDWLNVVDMTTYTTIMTVPLGTGGMAHSVDYNPTTKKIYITNFNNIVNDPDRNSIIVVDADTLTVIKRLVSTPDHPLREPSYVVVNPDTNRVYVANHNHGSPNGWVTIIDSKTDQITKTVRVDPGGELYGLALDRLHNRVFVTGIGVANVYAINGNTDLQDPPNTALKITRSNGQAIPLRMIAVNPSPDPTNPDKIRLWLTSSSTEANGLDQLISTTGEWDNGGITMTQPYLGTAMPPSPERGLRYDAATNKVFIASPAANLITVWPDNGPHCLNPLRPVREELFITTVRGDTAFQPERWRAR